MERGWAGRRGRWVSGAGVLLTLAGFLAGCGGGAAGGAGTAMTPGARVFLQNCVGCHGPGGLGLGAQPPLPGSATVNGDAAALAAWVMFGVRPSTSPAGRYQPLMPQFHYLQDRELADVLTYLRAEWGNRAPPVTADTIRATRLAHARQ